MPDHADTIGLSAAIDRVVESVIDPHLKNLAAVAYRGRVPWRGLLSSRSMIVLRDAARKLEDKDN
jgi:hypothetical protein